MNFSLLLIESVDAALDPALVDLLIAEGMQLHRLPPASIPADGRDLQAEGCHAILMSLDSGSDPRPLLRGLRASPHTGDLPILILSASGRPDGAPSNPASATQNWASPDTPPESLVAWLHALLRETDLKRQLRRAQRLESVGRLADGAAHDINNQLTTIVCLTSFLSERFTDEQSRKDLQMLLAAAEDSADLARRILLFCRRDPQPPQLCNPHDTVSDLEKLLFRVLGEDIELVLLPQAEAVYVNQDPGLIEQVVFNLAVNAREAMPQGGKLTLEVYATEDDRVILQVSDSGSGMDPDLFETACRYGYSANPRHDASGLGLAVAADLIASGGGQLALVSPTEGSGQGACFQISWAAATPDFLTPAVDPATRCGQGEHLLLVEDDDRLRSLLLRMLEGLNYQVTPAQHGEEALRILETDTENPPVLVISDVVMPRLGAYELERKLAENLTHPPPLLAISGFAGTQPAALPGLKAAFLSKPFTREQLAEALQKLLPSPSSSKEPS